MAKLKEKNSSSGANEPRINEEIDDCKTVRLVWKNEEGESKSCVLPIDEALRRARKFGKDLIEVNGKAETPICKIEEYTKYMYELKKAMKGKSKPLNSVKEVQLSTNIARHDLDIKANKAKKFISEGDKVRVVLTMRGRELSRREESKRCIYEFIEIMGDVSVPEAMPRDEGNKCTVILKRKN